MIVEDLGTWSDIVGTGKEESELGMAEDWNMDRDGEEREILNNWTI